MASRSRGIRMRVAVSLGLVALALTITAPVEASSAKTKRVSIKSNGAQGNGTSYGPALSANGRYIAFYSEAENLVNEDSNGNEDVFVRDRASGKTRRVSIRSNGKQAISGSSVSPSISASGRFVAFQATATNLVKGDTNGLIDIFVHDRARKKTTRVNVRTGGSQALGGQSFSPSISADGRFVAFQSAATNLVNGDTNGVSDVFVHDRAKKKTKRVSVRTGGGQALGADSGAADISADGRFVAFQSAATNLVNSDSNGFLDVFVHDRAKKKTKRVSVRTGGGQALGGSSSSPSVSANGRFVAFPSAATNLVTGDTNAHIDVFVHDRAKKKTKRVSVRTGGGQALGGSSDTPSVSANGRFVAFPSAATNLVTGDTNAHIDVFVHDRAKKKTKRVSVRSGGGQALGGSSAGASISTDGRFVGFNSSATNLKANDTNGDSDVFMRGPLR